MKRKKILKNVLIILLVLIILATGGYFGLRALGKYRLEQKGGDSKPMMEAESQDVQVVDEDSILYKGQRYTFNKDVMNFVFMGIDRSGEVQEGEGKNGRADLIILASVDHKNKKATLFTVNRNIMTDISIFDANGNYLRQSKAQLALSHTFGNSDEESARLVCDAVSNLFYGLPIHGYCALNLDVIPIINDMVGGVRVTLLKDYTEIDSSYVTGAEVVLNGDMAVRYVRQRDYLEGETNEARMERQKQYMKSFLSQARQSMKSDLTLPIRLYQSIQPYMVTDIGADQAVYLATQVLGYSMNDEMISLQGTLVHGTPYDEFYVDEDTLYQTIVDTYYEKAEQ